METISAIFSTLYNSPHYSFGWLVAACLAILPAIVSGNLVQHYIVELVKGNISSPDLYKQLILNIIVLSISICVISYAFYLYVWI